jgi:putative SOS response-associated peptidase YedK
VCNLYSVTKGQQAIREFTRAMVDRTGNLPPMPEVFPDYGAPIVRTTTAGRELALARWGMPTPPQYLVTKAGKPMAYDSGVTNIRNVNSSHWRRWLSVESRCVVPFTSFSENEARPNGSRLPIWVALGADRPLAFFAGIWARWKSVRRIKEGETENDIFAFLTTEPNTLVGTYHPKAMPVILTTPAEIEMWMDAPMPVALRLQRPLPDDALMIVAPELKQDGEVVGQQSALLL